MKQGPELARLKRIRVAPHAGAWIETRPVACSHFPAHVAPHAGAWIETLLPARRLKGPVTSPPTRGRGLKLVEWGCRDCSPGRPPRGGVD